eukprot:TRINITY_DN342_c0_g3_i1.p1 TRINITY_DN342_c0_g3~~TRINITY_DN342_c0_g3_i1.p1  ORF type:complete len:606 (-),score=212.26 TRINITY_DN342_c0_g3_i1:1899-3656(-)
MQAPVKYIVITGGILSGIGKGIIASSTGSILKSLNLKVTSIKVDPYLNCDAGTMSPFEHGEVFVLDDGGEVDLDLGNYERFLDITLTRDNNITTGKIYREVIEKERRGEYLGKTVQIIPHICDEIKNWIERVSHIVVDKSNERPDICVIELGGTVGDIESSPFIEAIRQFQFKVGLENFCHIHVSLVPILGVVGEQKTKPTQQSVRTIRALGLAPDIIVCRSSKPIQKTTRQKIASFCHVHEDSVIGAHDVSNIYQIPLLLESQHLSSILARRLKLTLMNVENCFNEMQNFANQVDQLSISNSQIVHIALVGKYTMLSDAYLSVLRSLQHASVATERQVVIDWIDSSALELDLQNNDDNDNDNDNGSDNENDKKNEKQPHAKAWELLKSANGILVPGGFGDRGVEGKILAANYARINNKPYLGICLGMQLAVIEIARNVLGHKDAHSTEFNPNTSYPVVVDMPELSKTHMGGTMRLGKRRTIFTNSKCLASTLYKSNFVEERHRHRYEVNPNKIEDLKTAGLHFTGHDDTMIRMEIAELDNHPFFFCTQYHPEFLSRPHRPSPPFVGFIAAAAGILDSKFPNLNH